MKKRNKREQESRQDFSQDPGFGTSLGALLGRLVPEAPVDPTPQKAAPKPPGPETWSLQLSVEQRRSKKLTRVVGLPKEHKVLVKRLRRELGVGVSVEGETIWVQGDQRDRLRGWFQAEGVRQIKG